MLDYSGSLTIAVLQLYFSHCSTGGQEQEVDVRRQAASAFVWLPLLEPGFLNSASVNLCDISQPPKFNFVS